MSCSLPRSHLKPAPACLCIRVTTLCCAWTQSCEPDRTRIKPLKDLPACLLENLMHEHTCLPEPMLERTREHASMLWVAIKADFYYFLLVYNNDLWIDLSFLYIYLFILILFCSTFDNKFFRVLTIKIMEKVVFTV